MKASIAIGFLTAGIAIGIAGSTAAFAQSATSPTRKVLQTDLQNLPGQEVLIFTTDWAPGQSLRCHMHQEGHEFAFIVEGELTFSINGIGEKVVKAGEVSYVAPGIPHYGRNASDKPARTVVVRIKDKSKPVATPVEPSGCP